MYSFILLSLTLNPVLKQYLWLIVLISCILLALGIIIGYLLGNTSLKRFFYDELEEAEHKGAIQKSVTENVGLGIIVYDLNGPVYANQTVRDLKDFIKTGIPKNLEIFLDTYDKDNHLKSDYLLSVENGVDVIRANYVSDNRIFEIKIIKKEVIYSDKDGNDESITESLHIILVDDITQIKDDERRQKDLAANVSHELKTPLTVIRASENFVDKINRGVDIPKDDLKKWANRILANAIRMQDIVEDFLVLSNNGEMKRMGIFDFYLVVEKSIANLSDYPAASNVTIVPPKRDAYPLGFGNSKLIIRIVTNLLTNAVKYIDYNGKTTKHEIKLNIVSTPDNVGIQVTDNGRGIPKKDIEHLFERFYRVDNSGSREVGGSGLGLAIAKEMAEIHDGNINVVSELNEGSTFTLFLPKASTAFERVFEDAKAGVLSDVEYYNAVLRFLIFEEQEYAMSKNITEITEAMDRSDISDELKNVSDSDKIKLLTMLGDDKFADLVDELTYVEVYDDDEYEDDYYEDEEEIEEMENAPLEEPQVADEDGDLIENNISPEEEAFDIQAQFYAQEVLEAFEASKLALEEEERREQEIREREELERQKKREAQEFLLQPVVQQSVKQANSNDKNQSSLTVTNVQSEKLQKSSTLEQKEVIHIHPNTEKKLYNNKGVKMFDIKSKSKNSGKSSKNASSKKEAEPPIRSAVKQVLDEAQADKK